MPRIKSTKQNSTSAQLVEFGNQCAAYFRKLRSRDPKADMYPNVNIFPPQYRHFAQAVLDGEKTKHERIVKQNGSV